jgi:hypothetical protein
MRELWLTLGILGILGISPRTHGRCRVSRWLNLMAGIGNSIYMRHSAPVKDNSRTRTINPFILTSTPPAGLLTKARPNPWAGYLAGGLGLGRVLARPKSSLASHVRGVLNPPNYHIRDTWILSIVYFQLMTWLVPGECTSLHGITLATNALTSANYFIVLRSFL